MKKIILSFAVLLFLMPQTVFAQDEAIQGFRATDLPLPRFVSLRSEKTYVRTGPALRYPIKWVYKQKGLRTPSKYLKQKLEITIVNLILIFEVKTE